MELSRFRTDRDAASLIGGTEASSAWAACEMVGWALRSSQRNWTTTLAIPTE